MKNQGDLQIFQSVAWSAGPGCHGGCGQKLYVKNGKLVHVEGDESHPWSQGRSCPRVLALTQYVNHPDRIRTPLKRVGARGEGNFAPIGWDEAFDLCESNLRRIRDQYGAEAVVFAQGTGRDAGGPVSFLAYSYGSPNWSQLGLSGQSCYTPRLGAMKAVQGDFCIMDASQFLPQRYDSPEYTVPKLIVVWAQDPTQGCPDGFFGHWVVDCMKRGSEIIVVDPRQNWMTSRSKMHLQCRPGTDAAVALGMLHVIINEGLYDKAFVEQWVYGFDELKERVQTYTPDLVEQISWVKKEKLLAAARLYAASKPAAIHWGVPIDMAPDGTSVAHAVMSLWTITGNLDIPGGNVIARASHGVSSYPYSTEELVQLYGQEMVTRLSQKRIGADRYPMVKNFRGWAHPDMTIEQMLTGEPYPIKGLWVQTCNPLGGQAARTRLHYEAMQKMEFVAAVELFHTPTTMALADVVLPAATFAEKDSIRSWWAPLSVSPKRLTVGECRSDWEINVELARRLNPEVGAKYATVIDLFNDRLKPSGHTFEELAADGLWRWSPDGPCKPYHRHERGLLRADGQPGFNTATGKVELFSKTYESWGLDPLPHYKEPAQSFVNSPELFAKYPLVMISGTRSGLFFHAEHRMIPWLREQMPNPLVDIHPETARLYGIQDGEWVYLENDHAKVRRKAKINPLIHPKTVNTMHGWWMPEEDGREPNLFGVWKYQINQLVPGPQDSDSGFGGGQYKTTLVRLARIPEEER